MGQNSPEADFSHKDASMPASDNSLWQQLTEWGAYIIAALVTGWLLLVRWWNGERFDGLESRISSVEENVKDHGDKLAEHDTLLGRLDVHLEHSQKRDEETGESIRRIHDKLDKLISNG